MALPSMLTAAAAPSAPHTLQAPTSEIDNGNRALAQLEYCLRSHDEAWCLRRHPQQPV